MVQIITPIITSQNKIKNVENPSTKSVHPITSQKTLARFWITFIGPDEAFALISERFSCSA